MDLLKRNSHTLVVLFLLGVSLQLSSASIKYPELPRYGWKVISMIVSPIEEIIHESFETTSFIWNRYVWLQGVSEKMRLLELEMQELKAERTKLLEHKYENERLGTLLAYDRDTYPVQVVANVIGRDPSNWSMAIKINKGSDDRVSIDDAVVNGDGLVGKISSVSSSYATVLLLTDPSSSVGAMSQESRITGMIEGAFSGEYLRLSYVENSLSMQIQQGERIITSGLDSIFPKGILIGFVKDIKNYRGGLFQDIEVSPVVNFRKLETVMVLTKKKNDD